MKCAHLFIERTLVAATTMEGQAEAGLVFYEIETAQCFVPHQRNAGKAILQSCIYCANR